MGEGEKIAGYGSHFFVGLGVGDSVLGVEFLGFGKLRLVIIEGVMSIR